MNLLFLDTETTGNMPGRDRLCSVCYKTGDKLVHELFRPPMPISIDAMATHHITEEMVADKPAFAGSELYEQIQKLVKDHVLVAHNAAFDMAVLEAEGISAPQHICTYRVAQHMDKEGKIPRFGLQYLRYLLKLNVADAPAHDARGDVLVLEALFDRLLSKMITTEGSEGAALEKMIALSTQPVLLHTMKFGKHKGKPFAEIAERDSAYLRWLLEAKRSDASAGKSNPQDEDLLHTLEYYLQ